MRRMLRPFLVFVAAATWLAFLLPWNGFADPDVFYHAKIAQLIWQNGPVHQFSWLDLTLLGTHFADLHFLFHVLLSPFVAVFGLFQGARILTVLLGGIFVAVFDTCLRWLKIRNAFLFTALLLLTQPFLTRLLLGKATPLALIWYVFGLTSLWKRCPWLVLLATLGFTLSHGGWLYLAGSCALVAFGDALYRHLVEDVSWKSAILEGHWRECALSFVGGGIGLIVHPNFPNDLLFSWTQVVTIGLGTPFQHVILGQEWLPSDPGAMFRSFAPWIVAMIVGLFGVLIAARKPLDQNRARFVASFGWVMAVLVALTLKSRRNAEYLAPVIAFWVASLWSLVDVGKMFDQFTNTVLIPAKTGVQNSSTGWISAFVGWAVKFFVAAVLILMLFRQPFETWKSFRPVWYPDNVYRAAIKPISRRAQAGDRVFHSSWDEFPMLFAADDRLHYISGLDPTFLYVASSTLSDQVRDVTWDLSTSTKEEAWSLIHDQLHARFVFLSKRNHQKFYEVIKSDSRYETLADVADSASFEAKAPLNAN